MTNSNLMSRLERIDWDFAGSTSQSPFSAIHWHPGRFVSQIPATLIGLLSRPGDTVLDPFVGSGTTIVEAQRLGRHSIGIDFNPVASLISQSKTLSVSATTVRSYVQAIKKDVADCLGGQLHFGEKRTPKPALPPSTQARKWYTMAIRENLACLWALFASYNGKKQILAHAAFSAILLPVCRETRHWGYVCDNTSPTGRHGGNVSHEIFKTLDRFQTAYEARDAERTARDGRVGRIEPAMVKCANVLEALGKVPERSVDLVVTSPPYFGVTDYIKAQRLSMEWFEWEIEPLRRSEIGARSKRHRGTACRDYVKEIGRTFSVVRKRLRKGGYCVVVVGQSTKRRSVLPQVVDALRSSGLTLKLDLNRRVSSQRRQAPSIKGEHLLILST